MQEDHKTLVKRRLARRAPKSGSLKRFLRPEVLLVILSLLCILLLGPVRSSVSPYPGLTFLASMVLFVTPGLVLSGLLLGRILPWTARLPIALATSIEVFGLPAVPMFALHYSLSSYLRIAAAILGVSLVVALLTVFSRTSAAEDEGTGFGSRANWLWLPFLVLCAVLAFISSRVGHAASEDTWLYLAYVQDYVGRDKLTLFPPYARGRSVASPG